MATLYFTKHFQKGHLLASRTYIDSISFPTVDGCVQWVKRINNPRLVKRNGYRVIDWSFQNYAR